MSHQKFVGKMIGAAVLAIMIGAVNSAARAQSLTVKTDKVMIDLVLQGGGADFGNGFHGAGHPFDFGLVKWEFSTVNGSFTAKATVTGTLYWDSLEGPGCGRLFIKFEDSAHHLLEQRTVETICPAPGGDANLSANKKSVSVSFASSKLKFVELLTQTGEPVTSTVQSTGLKSGTPTTTTSTFGSAMGQSPPKALEAPSLRKYDVKINNGNADFGSGPHALGGPSGNAVVQLSRDNGSVNGLVNGTLYWDALFGAGCSRIIIDFQTLGGTTLSSKTIDQCGPGGNANDGPNNKDVNQTFSGGSLMQIHLSVGTVVNNSFVNVQTKTCNFKECN
jgi:hypothetical protein